MRPTDWPLRISSNSNLTHVRLRRQSRRESREYVRHYGWRIRMSFRVSAIVVSALLTSAGPVLAADVKPDVEFHHKDGKSQIFDLDLNNGQKFVVRIKDTCPDAFDYSYAGLERG